MSRGNSHAVDTSVAIAALDASHAAHPECLESVRKHRPVLAGHAAFEVFSVLTRMPGRLSISPVDAGSIMAQVFPHMVALAPERQLELYRSLPARGISGGAVYDALVGEAARSNGFTLLTRDLRARRTYDLLGVAYEIV